VYETNIYPHTEEKKKYDFIYTAELNMKYIFHLYQYKENFSYLSEVCLEKLHHRSCEALWNSQI
jgi:hypothetical protein